MNKDNYAIEGSSCTLNSDSKVATIQIQQVELESISDSYVQIKIPNPKTMTYNAFSIVCDFKTLSNQSGTERRSTRQIKGGGRNDGFINGGGVVLVNSNDLKIINASVVWKKSSMTYDVSLVIRCLKNANLYIYISTYIISTYYNSYPIRFLQTDGNEIR